MGDYQARFCERFRGEIPLYLLDAVCPESPRVKDKDLWNGGKTLVEMIALLGSPETSQWKDWMSHGKEGRKDWSIGKDVQAYLSNRLVVLHLHGAVLSDKVKGFQP